MQTKKQSLIETISGVFIGLVISFLIQVVIYPAMGIRVTLSQNLFITSVFFMVSVVRGYFVRRLFNKIFKK
tara:strand:- start:1775 stop:1987 length:213 start_codon:yes stop_codon:yes gene_type:complete